MPRVTITIPDEPAQPYRFKLDRKVVSLGRSEENDIVIDCGSISGSHATMQRVHGGYELVDLDSTNGIKKDGERQAKIALANDLAVTLGDVKFDFELDEEELAALAEENALVDEEVTDLDSPARPQLPKAKIAQAAAPAKREMPEEREPEARSFAGAFLMPLVFGVLCIASFFIGTSIRHQKATGESLFQSILNKSERLEAPAVQEKAAASEEATPDAAPATESQPAE